MTQVARQDGSPSDRRSRIRWGARSAVAAGFALLTAALLGAPLYVSSAGSEAVQLALAGTCGSDTALRLTVVADPRTGEIDRPRLAALTADLDRTAAPLLEESAVVTIVGSDGLSRRGRIVSREGWPDEVGLDDLGRGEVVVQQATAEIVGLRAGDVVRLGASSAGDSVDVRVADPVADIPVLPEPAFWCGLRDSLRPSAFGDPPPPLLLATGGTIGDLDRTTDVDVQRTWEVRAQGVRTLGDARRLRDAFLAAVEQHDAEVDRMLDAALGTGPSGFRRADPSIEGMTTVVNRGEALADTIGRAVAPVRLAGVVAATSVLVAAATMLARERYRELRLAALRGVPPRRTAVRIWLAVAPAAAAGVAVGAGLALLAVRTLGPTPELEVAVVARGLAVGLAGAAIGTVVVAGTAAVVGDRFVDRSLRGHRWRYVPWELPVVVAAGASYVRLRDGGGLRFVGVESRGGELLAQAFPLLALVAVATVVARPLRWCIGRVRRAGGGWPVAVRLGWRRATAEPALATVLVTSVAAAVGAVVLSGTLSASASAALDDKASVFVGADLVVSFADPVVVPPELDARSTMVARAEGRLLDVDQLDETTASSSLDVLGVDRATFAAVARDVPGVDLPALFELLGPAGDGGIPAVVVNSGTLAGQRTLSISSRATTLVVRPVASVEVFPGLRSGTALVVVDAAALRATGLDVTDAVWMRDPPADAVQQLVDAGNRARTVVRPADVFDVISFRAQRWTYAVLAALGVLVGAVVLVLQLLVAEARVGRRRLSQVVLGRTGATASDRWTAALVESGLPLVVGGALGATAARVVAGRAIRLLDPLPTLAPRGRVVLPIGTVVAAGGVVLVVSVALAAAVAISDTRGDTMEVVRGTA